jgi:hypothetical protein
MPKRISGHSVLQILMGKNGVGLTTQQKAMVNEVEWKATLNRIIQENGWSDSTNSTEIAKNIMTRFKNVESSLKNISNSPVDFDNVFESEPSEWDISGGQGGGPGDAGDAGDAGDGGDGDEIINTVHRLLTEAGIGFVAATSASQALVGKISPSAILTSIEDIVKAVGPETISGLVAEGIVTAAVIEPLAIAAGVGVVSEAVSSGAGAPMAFPGMMGAGPFVAAEQKEVRDSEAERLRMVASAERIEARERKEREDEEERMSNRDEKQRIVMEKFNARMAVIGEQVRTVGERIRAGDSDEQINKLIDLIDNDTNRMHLRNMLFERGRNARAAEDVLAAEAVSTVESIRSLMNSGASKKDLSDRINKVRDPSTRNQLFDELKQIRPVVRNPLRPIVSPFPVVDLDDGDEIVEFGDELKQPDYDDELKQPDLIRQSSNLIFENDDDVGSLDPSGGDGLEFSGDTSISRAPKSFIQRTIRQLQRANPNMSKGQALAVVSALGTIGGVTAYLKNLPTAIPPVTPLPPTIPIPPLAPLPPVIPAPPQPPLVALPDPTPIPPTLPPGIVTRPVDEPRADPSPPQQPEKGDDPDDMEEQQTIQKITGNDVNEDIHMDLRPEYLVGGPELVDESLEQTAKDHQLFNDFDWVPNALGDVGNNPIIAQNTLDDAVLHMNPMYRNWLPNGTPIPGVYRPPVQHITINNYAHPQRAEKVLKRSRADFNTNQPVRQEFQNVIQLPGDELHAFTSADYTDEKPLRKRIRNVANPFSTDWEKRVLEVTDNEQ